MTATTAVLTPPLRRSLRRALFWIGLVTVALLAGLAALLLGEGSEAAPALAADSAQPDGARALVRVLESDGVEVTVVGSLDAALAAVAADPGDTTVLGYDPDGYLGDARWARLTTAAAIVLVDPDASALEALAPGVAPAGTLSGEHPAGCALPAAGRAGTVSLDGRGYRLLASASADALACFADGDAAGLVRLPATTDAGSVTVVGSAGVFDNERIRLAGNAALAIGLLGEHGRLVWYLPTETDLSGAAVPTIAELAPGWLTPLAVLGIVVVLAAALWRGRRLGPLVVEPLPVLVRASETLEGRARLYAASGARLRALDALRIGALARIAGLCGLPRGADVEAVVASAAAATGERAGELRALLIETVPAGDGEMVRLSDELVRLERRVAAALRPRDPTPGDAGGTTR
ncbi:MAG: DUF4350 domain-containing protein [Microbacteriaceae bacterium]